MFVSHLAFGHVPYIETADLTVQEPFIVEDVPNSKAIFSYLKARKTMMSIISN